MSLRVVPVSFRDACGFVQMWHRHQGPPAGCNFCSGATVPQHTDDEDVLRGVVIVARPVARMLDDGLTLEVGPPRWHPQRVLVAVRGGVVGGEGAEFRGHRPR